MRYRAILIDDEVVILKGLKQLIDWAGMGIEIVGEAQDGIRALEMIDEWKPDILVSDIAMPGLDGIALLRTIYEKKLKVKTIFLSGYQDFGYAQEAVRYEASDYLLKPVKASELEHALGKVIGQINSERDVRVLRKKDSEAEVAFQEILLKKQEEMGVLQMKKLLGVKDENHGALCVMFHVVVKKAMREEQNESLIRFEIFEYIQDFFEGEGTGGIIKKDHYDCCVMLFDRKDKKRSKKAICALSKMISQKYPAMVLAGVGEWTDNGGKVSYLYSTARFAAELYYFREEPYIDIGDVSQEYTHSTDEYERLVERVGQMIAGYEDADEIVSEITGCVRLLGDIHYGNKNMVISKSILLAETLRSVLTDCGFLENGDDKEQERFLREIRQKSTFRLLQKTFESYYEKAFLRFQLLESGKEARDILRIKQFMALHFRENLTLEEVAEYIGMNSSYISTFFKKGTGKNFKAYLTELRMQEALRLLNSTNMKSYEIADAIGYKDVKQFRENFKEFYGVSPQKYKRKPKDY